MQDLKYEKRALEDVLKLLILSVAISFAVAMSVVCIAAHATPPDASAQNAIPVRMSDGTNYNDATHPLYTSPSTGATTGDVNLKQINGVAVSQTNTLPVTQSTLATASIVNSAADIVTTTSTVVSLGVTSRKITVKNCDATAVINVDIKAGTASVSNGVRLDPGVAFTFTPAVGASSFSYYSTAPTLATKTLTYTAE